MFLLKFLLRLLQSNISVDNDIQKRWVFLIWECPSFFMPYLIFIVGSKEIPKGIFLT